MAIPLKNYQYFYLPISKAITKCLIKENVLKFALHRVNMPITKMNLRLLLLSMY